MHEENIEEPASSRFKLQVDRWTRRTLEQFRERMEELPPAAIRLAALGNEVGRRELVIDLLFALAPEAADPHIWTDWLKGGPSPLRDIRTPKFEQTKEASGRKIRGALNNADTASARTRDARDKVRAARADLEVAEKDLANAEAEEKRTLDLARGYCAWAFLNEVSRVSSGVFSMGPAWTLMRVISGHTPDTAGSEKRSSEAWKQLLEKHRQTRAERSKEMLRILNEQAGDIAFEVNLFEHLWDFFEPETAANRATDSQARRSLKNGVGRNVAGDDARAVASGVNLAR